LPLVNKMEQENKQEETSKSIMERAEALQKQLSEETLKAEQQLKSLAEMRTRDLLGGKTSAGTTAPTPPPEESPREYAQRVLRGELN